MNQKRHETQMPAKITPEEAATRRDAILSAALWCFLNFGFAKTSLDDIAKRAAISRTLLYKTFKDKENIYSEVFQHWLLSRHAGAQAAAHASAPKRDRLIEVTRVMVVEPWSDMVGAPMSAEFFNVCERLNPELDSRHRTVMHECVEAILGDTELATIFVLAVDGLLTVNPSVAILERRVGLLVDRFIA